MGWYGIARALTEPVCWAAGVCWPTGGGTGAGRCFSTLSARWRRAVVSGSIGMMKRGLSKSKQLVRSPQIALRQAEMFGLLHARPHFQEPQHRRVVEHLRS